MKTVAIQNINRLSVDQFVQQFGNVFEHSPWVAQAVVNNRPFSSLHEMIAVMTGVVKRASDEKKLALIRSHPELGYDKIKLTADSQHEQNQAQLTSLTKEQRTTLIELNEAYREKFHFPFVICVRNYNSYDSIIKALQMRLSSSAKKEMDTAIAEICQIATLRIEDIAQKIAQTTASSLSTHLLDLVSGQPAANVKVVLYHRDKAVFEGYTDQNGRCQLPASVQGFVSGAYQFAFYVADYFKKQGYALTDPPFLDVIRVDFGITRNVGHYHVPLLISPYGFSTYKGS
ncbi:2-oxo-4-hydroxy-4-carboxy-5-ureidoimidazoline decarboxylase [Commensalibacter oyaizuii]|uniref:2-oxo-4-hydroxy-4-carboxy-5-ureidoimidazoline decarboxylase n=1 Tax=Commensalibacter oyaizuii TaxID=3043873 RepID=A0ABT6PYN7_9PROT|nr:2-oxo-4-hydroxy-4-carboxy-5-ureidoimidazoline decarboxylase [Commensalibacter sp. TBRC 16381]MDI2089971.1 2-oxo-4-hydroxy-4-carboxy-5-ureidoimidazoline decarboxylase [Commensalibacter sp. TBRC 16381]